MSQILDTCILREVEDELSRARATHNNMRSAHEAYSVILEELDEFWEEVRRKRDLRSKHAMRRELIQTAAMCVRAISDLALPMEGGGK